MLVSSANKLVSSVFFGLSAGMLTYIACSEIIVNEFAKPELHLVKFALVLVGMLAVSSLSLVVDTHDHEGEHHH